MDDSILDTVKRLLGIEPDNTPFDAELIVHINSAIMALEQLGVCKTPNFEVTSTADIWSEFLLDGVNLQAAKHYVYLQIKQVFDPPATSFALDAIKRQLDMYEWRLMVQADPTFVDPTVTTTTGDTFA
jgi:hypothetical protein